MINFLLFRRMLTPLLIQFLFWLVLIVTVVVGIIDLLHKDYWHGFELIVFGPILIRILCEVFILFFSINETLTDVKNTVQERVETPLNTSVKR